MIGARGASGLVASLTLVTGCTVVSTDAAGHFEATGGPKIVGLGSHDASGERLTAEIDITLEEGGGRLQVVGPDDVELDEELALANEGRAYMMTVPSGAAGAWRVAIDMSPESIAGRYTVEWTE